MNVLYYANKNGVNLGIWTHEAFRTKPPVGQVGSQRGSDGVASLSQLNASSTLKARSAKLHHAATNVDREDNRASGSVVSTSEC